MNISVSTDTQRRIEKKLAEGRYSSPDHVVRDALDALEDGVDSPEQTERFHSEIREAVAEVERGEYADYSRDDLPKVFERARSRGLDLLKRTDPHRVPDADVPADS